MQVILNPMPPRRKVIITKSGYIPKSTGRPCAFFLSVWYRESARNSMIAAQRQPCKSLGLVVADKPACFILARIEVNSFEEPPMPVDTRKVNGRRIVDYKSFDELLADADRMGAGNVKTLGNWSPGQIFQHLAIAYNGSIDGLPKSFPLFIRVMGRMFKKKLISGAMPPGLKLPAKFALRVMPDPTSTEQGLANLHAAVSR